jgi:hypothetical protein
MGMNPKSQRIFDLFAENSLEILPKSVINQDVDLVNSLGELLECGIISNNNPYYITLTERGQHMLIILLMRNALKEMAEELGEYDEPQDSSKPVKQKPEKRKNPNVMEVSFDIGNQRQY